MKAEGVGLVGSVLIITGRVVTVGVDEIWRSELAGWEPCERAAEEPQLTGTEVEDDVAVTRGDCTGKVGVVEVVLARGDGNTSPGAEDCCGAEMAESA